MEDIKKEQIATKVKKEQSVAEAVKEALEAALPATAGIVAETIAGVLPKPQPRPVQLDLFTKCPDCKQLRVACKGEHVLMSVYPSNPRYGRAFRGIILNGETYLSNSAQHKIKVPAKNDFTFQIQEWERNEDEMMNGRVAQHDSGAIGRGASGFNPAHAGWR